MKHVCLLACLSVGLAAPVHAQSQTERLDAFAALVAGNNCQVQRAESEALFEGADFSDDAEVEQLMFTLLLSGRMMFEPDRLRLLDASCPVEGFTAPDDTAMVEAYVATLEARDCEMAVTDAQVVLGEAGINNPNAAAQIGAMLVAEGRLAVLTDPYRMRVVSEACPAQ